MYDDLWLAEIYYTKWYPNKDSETYSGERHIKFILIKAKNQFEALRTAIGDIEQEYELIKQFSKDVKYSIEVEQVSVRPFTVPDQYECTSEICDIELG